MIYVHVKLKKYVYDICGSSLNHALSLGCPINPENELPSGPDFS